MAWKPIVIDESFVSEGGERIVHIPEGYYLMEGVEVEPSPEDRAEDKHPYLNWHLKIAKGGRGFRGEPTVGKKLAWNCTMVSGKKGQFNNGRIINLTGIKAQADPLVNREIKTYKAFQAVATGLSGVFKGKLVTALIADGDDWVNDKGEHYKTSKIVALYPAAEYDDLAASMADAPAPRAPEPAKATSTRGRKAQEPAKEAEPEPSNDVPEDEDIDAIFASVR